MNHGTRANKGCNLGSKCKDFHPKMCPMSISKSECIDQKCTLSHVKGTKRKLAQVKGIATVGKANSQSIKSSVVTNTTDDDSSNQSFLDQVSLLKKELVEMMDCKMTALFQTNHQRKLPSQNCNPERSKEVAPQLQSAPQANRQPLSNQPQAQHPTYPQVQYPQIKYSQMQNLQMKNSQMQNPQILYPQIQHPLIQYPLMQHLQIQYTQVQHPQVQSLYPLSIP